MTAEAFHLLSRGGAVFDKAAFKTQILGERIRLNPTEGSATTPVQGLPADLDFFKYAKNVDIHVKRKASVTGQRSEKRQKIDSDDEEEEEEAEDEESPTVSKHSHRVAIKGDKVPANISTFKDLKAYSIPSHLYTNLRLSGYDTPTAIQSHCIPILLDGRDLVAISPTGTGKTLGYLLPIFSCLSSPASSSIEAAGVRALVLVPTKELAHQIHNECLKLAQGRKWKVVLFSKATANALSTQAAGNKVDIIIATPLRLVSTLHEGTIKLDSVRHLVLDEADRMFDKEFLDQIQEIIAACTSSSLQKAVFSATLPAAAEKMAMDMLHDPIRIVVGLKDTPLPLVHQSLSYVADDHSKLPSLLTHFAQPYNPPVLIFTSTQTRASSLAEELTLHKISNVECLHAGMTQKEREDSMRRMRRGECWIMITTEVMARGMDIKGVQEVINYDFPTTIQSYIHRIGRTGRAGREGKAITFFTNDDSPFLKMIANVILQSGFPVPEWILKLPKPSKVKRRLMGKAKRPSTVNPARQIGRQDAIKKRDMILGSKRRAAKGNSNSGVEKEDSP